jgi:ADP-ribosylation factor GTPase-activating protein 2/3
VITDEALGTPTEGTSTPAGEPADDFFSSWDKPTIKRPSNPPSRTGTPLGTSRTASPFLSAGTANGAARPKSPSPLSSAAAEAENALPAPTAIRTTSSSAIRKGPAVGGAKRTNILGAKKGQKLGAKKVAGEEIDFEAAEKAAKAEAERIEKLGYDPEAEAAEESTKAKSPTITTRDTSIIAPTPISPPQTGYGNKQQHQRSPSEIERLGMGMGRLGFGQVGRTQSASSAPAPKKLGFGSVGNAKAAAEGIYTFRALHIFFVADTSRRVR